MERYWIIELIYCLQLTKKFSHLGYLSPYRYALHCYVFMLDKFESKITPLQG